LIVPLRHLQEQAYRSSRKGLFDLSVDFAIQLFELNKNKPFQPCTSCLLSQGKRCVYIDFFGNSVKGSACIILHDMHARCSVNNGHHIFFQVIRYPYLFIQKLNLQLAFAATFTGTFSKNTLNGHFNSMAFGTKAQH